MGILGNLFGMQDETSSDIGARIALASQVLMAMDQGKTADIAPSIAALNAQRRKLADEMKTNKWLQNQAAAMADKNPRLAQMLQDAPPDVGSSLISQYYQTLLQPPDWKTFESGGDIYRYNPLDPNSKPEVFFDGPEDPFKQMVQGILGGGQQTPPGAPAAPAGGTPAPAAPGAPADASSPPAAPATPQAEALPPMLKTFAEAYALPDGVTAEEVMSVAQAGAIGGKDQAAATAEAIRKQYADKQNRDFELTKQQASVAESLKGSYWRVGQKYQAVIDIANNIQQLPDDPNGFERMMAMYGYMRSLDPLGSVRDGDVQQATNASGPWQRLEQLASMYAGKSGGEIPLAAAQEMKRLILQMGETASKTDYIVKRKTMRQGIAAGIPADKAEEIIFGGLQPDAQDSEGYKPRFTPGERKSDAAMATGSDAAAVDAPAQAPSGTPQVKTIEDYNKLDPGTVYIDPNGIVKTKGGTK